MEQTHVVDSLPTRSDSLSAETMEQETLLPDTVVMESLTGKMDSLDERVNAMETAQSPGSASE